MIRHFRKKKRKQKPTLMSSAHVHRSNIGLFVVTWYTCITEYVFPFYFSPFFIFFFSCLLSKTGTGCITARVFRFFPAVKKNTNISVSGLYFKKGECVFEMASLHLYTSCTFALFDRLRQEICPIKTLEQSALLCLSLIFLQFTSES